MARMTGGQALARQLQKEGVEVIFALPGAQLDWLFDALYDLQDSIRIIHTRHEQATSYMADGYARTSGRVGVGLVVPGPGLLNAMAGLSTAYACSSPVLSIAGQIETAQIGKGRGMLHEIPHQLETMAAVTKWAARAEHPEDVAQVTHQAMIELRRGRPRPVHIEVPPDALRQEGDMQLLEPEAPQLPSGDPEALDAAARALVSSEKPVIFAGGGVMRSGAWEELQHLAELLQAPVVQTAQARGAISDHHYLAQVSVASPHLLPDADVVLAVGTRFLQPATATWGVKGHQTVIQLDIDGEEIGRNYPPSVSIQADARLGLAGLIERIERQVGPRPSSERELRALQDQVRAEIYADEHRAPLVMAVREALPEDGILVADITQTGYWARIGFPVYHPRSLVTAGYQGTLGYGFATALGAQVAHPDKKVVCITGDGGFLYNAQELSTAKRHGINLVTVIFNDDAYGNVRSTQEYQFKGRTIASDLYNPDFVKLAESYGVIGMRARDSKHLVGVLKEALAAEAPVVIEMPVGGMPPYTLPRW